MNPLLSQFVIEARDQLEQASTGLLDLERRPGDAGVLQTVFRAIHTLKGSSGLVGVAPLTVLVHAAEDLLGAVRDGRVAVQTGMVDVLLDGLDRVGIWVDALETTGDLPSDAGDTASIQASRLRAWLGTPIPAKAAGTLSASWIARLDKAVRLETVRRAQAGGGMPSAVVYEPDPECFFRGDDPLALVRRIPERLALVIEPTSRWPQPESIDPLMCALRFRVLSAAPATAVEAVFRTVGDQARITPLALADLEADLDLGADLETNPALPASTRADVQPEAGSEDRAACRRILAEQVLVLELAVQGEQWLGRIDSVERTVCNCLGAIGDTDHLGKLASTAVAARATGSVQPLRAFVAELAGVSVVAEIAPPPEPAMRPARVEEIPADTRGAEVRGGAGRVLRVDSRRVDTLIETMGELIVAKNALPFLARRAEEEHDRRELSRAIKAQYEVIHRLVQELQSAVLAIRMLPVSQVFQRFPRLVRDLAHRLDKRVELAIEGEETEADKTVIESLADPLLHLIRNSIDHGIEPPEDRIAAGKPAHGTIRLAASRGPDAVIIEVGDDGCGIDSAAIRAKVVAQGILDAVRIQSLSEDEVLMLVFHPGFSSREEVSELSGRGVGLDAVLAVVETAGGTVALSSRLGQGTTVRLTLPLSLAIVRVMTVEVGGQVFGVPMDVVAETVRVPSGAFHSLNHGPGGERAFVLRDSVVPAIDLANALGLPPAPPAEQAAVLVVRLNGERVGVVVEAFRERLEVLVKPMEGALAGVAGYAGTALLGDGRVLPILDLKELI
ncbi:MAG TPA: chemotaxis protein CheA [Azospirillaceae bacterium]|nr:chemotaxis protein CheA [Azospirillaceae bacterium]